jgi:hypothetical protein
MRIYVCLTYLNANFKEITLSCIRINRVFIYYNEPCQLANHGLKEQKVKEILCCGIRHFEITITRVVTVLSTVCNRKYIDNKCVRNGQDW